MKVLETQELENLRDLNKKLSSIKNNIAEIEIAIRNLENKKNIAFSELETLSSDFVNTEKEMTEKYGNITVNLETGEINE
jgi:predicted  nucleic acid-binding Zn-ribbon protein